MKNLDVNKEIVKIRQAAEKGYTLALDSYEKIELSIKNVEKHIQLANCKQSKIQHFQNLDLISKSEQEIQALNENLEKIRQNIEFLHNNSQNFSIVVYGTKLAGKSTLMEILTHGNGETIGKGTQRTAEEVRTYYWSGFKITDIAGVDFSVDEVNNALKTADIILFLMTNDAKLSEEAEVFAKLKNLGKPILGIINVRKTLNFRRRNLILKELNKILPNSEEIENVIANFKKLAPNYNQNWNEIKFLPTHLLSAFYSGGEKVDDKEIFNASNFGEVENFILEKIRTDGKFLVFKNFVDSVAVQMNNILLKLFEHAGGYFKESKVWIDKSKKILLWRDDFWKRSQKKLYDLFDELSKNLKTEIPKFVEQNYNANNVNEKWLKFLQELGYVERYQQVIKIFSDEYRQELKKFNDNLAYELHYTLNGTAQKNIKIKNNTVKKYLAAIAPNFLMLVPGINFGTILAITVGSSIFNFLIDKKKSNSAAAREKFIAQLNESAFDMLSNINEQAHNIFSRQIFGKVEDFSNTFLSYSHTLARIGESQSKIAETVIEECSNLNKMLFVEAAQYKGAGKFTEILATMRIPGTISVVIAKASNVNTHAVSELLNEKFLILNPQETWENTMKKLLGCEFEIKFYALDAKIENKTFSITPKNKVSAQRLILAQQISPYPILEDMN